MESGGSIRWKLAGVVFLAVIAIAAAGVALLRPMTPPSVSESVANYTPPPQPTFQIINAVVFGDSIAHGSGASDTQIGWAGRLKRNQTWNMTSLARGGTGFVSSVERAVAAQESCRLDRCPNFREMIEAAKAVHPDLIIVSGGRNDIRLSAASEAIAINEFFTTLRTTFPEAKIIATNALWDATTLPPGLDGISATIQESVTSVGGAYFDLGQPLQGKPELVAQDGSHPNDRGHELIFGLMLDRLREAGLARG
ncbi:hypothetical protein DC347_10490 [Pseudarthrobacter sp. AG30]|uniref:SGNH/GDSL hydrolase family protein n=1 Tax=Pseudarthrobacter sp. AG30 TaxID=2249742 RepID=UPI000D642D71|nr:SGNH/GDSL hydrolase family protein [Pseudarthrobacter sp. AG30]RAX17036.1 hypothetical protein DC347_10490 [Pseudarthrobacter sp. AG30]